MNNQNKKSILNLPSSPGELLADHGKISERTLFEVTTPPLDECRIFVQGCFFGECVSEDRRPDSTPSLGSTYRLAFHGPST